MISFRVKINFSKNGVKQDINRRIRRSQFMLDNQIAKDSNTFIPMDEHYLEKSVFTASKFGQGRLIWNTPYARRLYYNPQYNFSKDLNPKAQGLWFEAAKKLYKKDWEDVAQKAYDA